MKSIVSLSIVSAALLLLTGCQRSDKPPLYTVKGTVTYDGKPLPNATVSFLPEAGLVAVGRTNDAGVFTLKTQGTEGAMAGTYRVVFTATDQVKQVTPEEAEHLTDAERKKLYKSRIPEKYGNPNATEIPATVGPTEKNEFTFDLSK